MPARAPSSWVAWKACAAAFILGAAGGFLGKSASRSDSASGGIATPTPPGPFGASTVGWLDAEWRASSEIEMWTDALPETDLRELFRRLGGDFSRGHPNAPDTFRAALRRLARTSDSAALLAEVEDWIAHWELPRASRRQLWREAVVCLCAETTMGADVLAGVVRGREPEDIFVTLEALLSVRRGASPAADAQVAADFLVRAGVEVNDWWKGRAQAAASAAWLSRDPAGAMQLAASTDRLAIRRVLEPGLRRLLALEPARAEEALRLAATNGVYPESIGESAFAAGFSPVQLRRALDGVAVGRSVRSISRFAAGIARIAPTEMGDMSQAFSASEVFGNWAAGNNTLYPGAFAIPVVLAERDPDACRAWLAALDAPMRSKVLNEAWTSGHGNASFARLCLDELPLEGAPGSYHLDRIFREIAETDAAAALLLLEQMPEQHRGNIESDIRLAQILREIKTNPEQAFALAQAAPEQLRVELLARAVQAREDVDEASARKWLERLGNLETEIRARMVATYTLGAGRNLERASADLLARGVPPEEIEGSLRDLVHAYAASDPVRAQSWLARLQEGNVRAELTQQLAERWSTYDPVGAAEWVETLPTGKDRDRATNVLAQTLRDEPETALAWAVSIHEPQARTNALVNLVTRWGAADFETAQRLVAEAPVTESERTALQTALARTPGGLRWEMER